MKTSITDPWGNGSKVSNNFEMNGNNVARFEDSFVIEGFDASRLSDSEQYLARLYSRLKNVKGGTSKKDLMNSLSDAKEDCIARLVTNGQSFESEKEAMLAANPLIRHIAPHLQALTASELVHLLKADVLQTVTDEQYEEDETKIEREELQIEETRTEQVQMKPLEREETVIDKLEIEGIKIKESERVSLNLEKSVRENSHSIPNANKCEVESVRMENKKQ